MNIREFREHCSLPLWHVGKRSFLGPEAYLQNLPRVVHASCIFSSASAPSWLAAHAVAVLHSLQAYVIKRDVSQTVKSV